MNVRYCTAMTSETLTKITRSTVSQNCSCNLFCLCFVSVGVLFVISWTKTGLNLSQTSYVNFSVKLQDQPQLFISSHKCRGLENVQRICEYDNLLLFNGSLYYLTENKERKQLLDFEDVDLTIMAEQEGEGTVFGSEIRVVTFDEFPAVKTQTRENIEIALFQHRYGDMTYERALLTHTALVHKHLCEIFGKCLYGQGLDARIVFWDKINSPFDKWPTDAQQVWTCFTKHRMLQLSQIKNDNNTVYYFRKAIIGVGDRCADFYGCNDGIIATARRGLMYGDILLSWKDKIRTCAEIIKAESLRNDTRYIGRVRYPGPQATSRLFEHQRIIRFIDQEEGPKKFIGIKEAANVIEEQFGAQYIQIKTISKHANLWDRVDLFKDADIVISPFWEALNGLIFMNNCTCLIVIFPAGVDVILHNQQVEVLKYGPVGLASYFGQYLKIYVHTFTIPNKQNTKVAWDLVSQQDERFLAIPEKRRFQLQKTFDCAREIWSSDCQLYWISQFSTIQLDVAFFRLSMLFAMKTTQLCYQNTYPFDLVAPMWPLSQCIAGDFSALQSWLLNSRSFGKVLPPGANLPSGPDFCNVVYGWIHATILRIIQINHPHQCCKICQEDAQCTAWNFCQCLGDCGNYTMRTCILKTSMPSPYHTYIQGDINQYNRWVGGFPTVPEYDKIQICTPEKVESDKYTLNCPEEDCHASLGNFSNSKHLDDTIVQVVHLNGSYSNYNNKMRPRYCCELCRNNSKCNIWTICNSPEGCPCDTYGNISNGCLDGMMAPFTCVLKFSDNVAKGIRPKRYEQGYFTSLVSGYIPKQLNA